VIGDESRVVAASCGWLTERGWTVHTEQAFCDVVATRAGQAMYAEVKGRTSSPGRDVDTLYGQLLRRVPAGAVGRDVFAVVVPDVAVKFAERVSLDVRRALNVHIYGVTEKGRGSPRSRRC
jgi:hypothetical protein